MVLNSKIWRESASLILAARGVFSSNYKILCLKRSGKSAFMPGTYVFPGGNISLTDSNIEWLKLYEKFGLKKEAFTVLKPIENIPEVLKNDVKDKLPKYLSFRICAIRETFEECGILLCKNPKIDSDVNSKWASFIGGPEIIKWQHKVHDDASEFLNLCSHFQIVPDVWALKNWSNWVTPPQLSSKFNTIFFLATLPQMPVVCADEREIQNLMWTTADECILLNNKENVLLPIPQYYEISRLKLFKDINTLSKFATERSKFGYETYWPFRIKTDSGLYTILPGDELYPKEIDKDKSEVCRMPQLPESSIQHRLFHKTVNSNELQIKNFSPKCQHVSPCKN